MANVMKKMALALIVLGLAWFVLSFFFFSNVEIAWRGMLLGFVMMVVGFGLGRLLLGSK